MAAALHYMNIMFTCLFAIETVMKIYAYGVRVSPSLRCENYFAFCTTKSKHCRPKLIHENLQQLMLKNANPE